MAVLAISLLAFRGNDTVREAMHAAFLYHAISAGMDMGIVNAGQLAVYDDLPKPLLEAVEDILFNRREDATDRLVNIADTLQSKGKKRRVNKKWRKLPVEKRLSHALVEGIAKYIEADTEEARLKHERPIQVIEGSLDGWNESGWRVIRRWKNVPTPSRKKCAGHEKGCCTPDSLY